MNLKKTCYTILLVIVVVFFLLPSFLSTKLGTKALISAFEQKFTKKIQLSNLCLSWFGQQKILQLEISDLNQPWFSSSEITINSSLISLIFSHKLKNLAIADPKFTWEEKMLSSSHKKSRHSFLHIFAGFDTLQITNGSVKIIPLVYPIIQFDKIDLKWNRGKNVSNLSLQANSLQKQAQGFIKLQSNFLFSKKTAFLSLQAEHFPSDLFVYTLNLPSSWFASTFSIQTDLKLTIDHAQKGNLSGHLDFVLAKAAQAKGSADIAATFSLKKTKPFFTPLTLAVTCTHLPTELLTIFTQNSSIRSLIGDVFDLKLDIEDTVKEQLYAFYLSSPLLKMQGNAYWDKKQEKILANAIPLSFTLTQDNYAFIRSLIKLPVLTLTEPSVFQGVINQFLLHTKGKGFFPLPTISDLSFNTRLINEKLYVAFQDEVSVISSLQIKAHVSEELISSQIQADISARKKGTFFSDISWTKQTQSLDAEIKCQAMPSYLLEGLFSQISPHMLCGPVIDARLHTKLITRSGPLSIEILSSYSSFSLEGHLQKGEITLSKPFYCQMNKEAGDYALKQLFPYFSFLQPKNPISIKIAAKETIWFSYPFNSMQLVVPTVEIEVGQTLCHNQSITDALFNLLKINQFDATLTFPLWIAPISMHIDKGLITIERVEMLLANLYEVAIWGKADLKNNLSKMKVGLPASTLDRVFKIPNLSADYVLVLRLEGNLEKLQINLKEATAKIAALFICQRENKNPLNIFFPSCKFLQKTPIPPAKHPFPWEQATALMSDGGKRKKFTQEDKPLKQLLRVLR